MKRNAFNIFATFAVFVLIVSCATDYSKKWTPDGLSGLKGKTMEEISSAYGQPTQRYSINDGRQVWEYRRESDNGMNTMAKIGSFGMMSGKNSAYVDILRVYFLKDVVLQTALDENVVGVLTTGGASIQHPQAVADKKATEKQVAGKQATDNQVSGKQTTVKQVTDKQPTDKQVTNGNQSSLNTAKSSSSTVSPTIMTIVATKASIRQEPSVKAKIIVSLKKGTEVISIQEKKDWVQVEFEDGKTGWCHKSLLK